jgi:hypothetical protein
MLKAGVGEGLQQQQKRRNRQGDGRVRSGFGSQKTVLSLEE